MKGIVFNLLQEVVETDHGPEVWDLMLERSGVGGAYTALGNYPHEQLGKVVMALAQHLQLDPQVVIRSFGRKAMPLLAKRYGALFSGHRSTRSFLLSLNDIIHPEVRKLYPGADAPDFTMVTRADGSLELGYRSSRQLCSFAHGLIEGAADHYREDVTATHPQCTLRGDAACIFDVAFGTGRP